MGVRTGNWLSLKQAQALLNAPDITTTKGLRDRGIIAVLIGCGLRRSEVAGVGGRPLVQRRTSGGKGESRPVAGSEPSAVQKTYVCCTPPEDSSSSNVCNKGTFAAHLQRTEFCRSRAEKSDFGKVYLRRDQVLLIPLCSTA